MKKRIADTLRQKLLQERNLATFFGIGGLVLALIELLIILKICTHQTVVVTPPVVNESFWVDHKTVSESYLYQFSEFLAMTRFNIDPSNVDAQNELFLQQADSNDYGVLKKELVEQAKKIKREHLSIALFINQIHVDQKHLKVLIDGTLMSMVGGNATPEQPIHLLMQYRFLNGRLYLSSMSEVAPHA
ncbi:MAG: type IV conjugative transfer system protein TraE [Gammaproteobacteria bacterium]|nr:type IV conjugative transfer system protein TraE [Gammaproteobacteria bacterium]MCD8525494.1 type IV conjugative transfer system protein TraE [Gammaproteobacteria bacterium]